MAGGGGKLRDDRGRQFNNPGSAQKLQPYNPNQALNYDELGQSLRKAIQFGDSSPQNIQEIRKLLDAGADINWRSSDGTTALWLAARKGDRQTIILLLDNGANPNIPQHGKQGLYPLDVCSSKLENEKDPRQLLLGRGSLTRMAQNESSQKSYDELGSELRLAARDGNKEKIQSLLASGADINWRSGDGTTPMWLAARSGRPDVVELLLNAGANPNIPSRANVYPLDVAMDLQVNDFRATSWLLSQHGAQACSKEKTTLINLVSMPDDRYQEVRYSAELDKPNAMSSVTNLRDRYKTNESRNNEIKSVLADGRPSAAQAMREELAPAKDRASKLLEKQPAALGKGLLDELGSYCKRLIEELRSSITDSFRP